MHLSPYGPWQGPSAPRGQARPDDGEATCCEADRTSWRSGILDLSLGKLQASDNLMDGHQLLGVRRSPLIRGMIKLCVLRWISLCSPSNLMY